MSSSPANETVLPATDRRSPFYINVPTQEAKPITHLVAYFKLWKHFVAALIAYLRDLLKAKEFESNLNLQLVGSVQFPGFRDLPYKCILLVEQNLPSPKGTSANTPKTELSKNLAILLTPTQSLDMRPHLSKTKSALSFLKSQPFTHRKSNSFTSLKSEASLASAMSTGSGGSSKSNTPSTKNNHNNQKNGNARNNQQAPPSILAAAFVPKLDVRLDPTYFPEDSLFMSMPGALVNNHYNTYLAQSRLCREITYKLIPRLESLSRNLSIKIKEIRSSLKDESFANNSLVKEVSQTGAILKDFVSCVHKYSAPEPVLKQEEGEEYHSDPFLVKLGLDFQIKNQLIHENYIFASYVNLQSISKDLLNYVIKDLNYVTDKLIKATKAEAVYTATNDDALFNLGVALKNKLKNPEDDWAYFIAHNPSFLNNIRTYDSHPKKENRVFKEIVIPFANSVHSKCLRSGYIFKKQKLMKLYVSHYYLLTCNYLHEFKIDSNEKSNDSLSTIGRKKAKGKIGGVIDHESTPVRSYNLNDYGITVKDEKDFKFVLTKTSNTLQKITFRCQNEKDFVAWSTDLHDLLKFLRNHLRRFQYIEAKMAARDKALGTDPATGGMSLSNMLRGRALLDKIQKPSPSLTGMFTPRVQSPDQDHNPFEDGFSDSKATDSETGKETPTAAPASEVLESPQLGAHSPQIVAQPSLIFPQSPSAVLDVDLVSPTDSFSDSASDNVGSHQGEHERYLRMQNEIMAQQQELLKIQGFSRPTLSRNSSAESFISVLEQNTSSIAQFISHNQGFVQQIGGEQVNNDSVLLIPKVLVLNHEHEDEAK